MSDNPTDSPEIPYEQARDELVDTVRKLETGGTTLEESLALWERGEHLAAICKQWLDGARERLRAATGEDESDEAGDADAEETEEHE
ncbi:MAG: exodeoxyribonuclease VII small subunit [Nocardioidaceae bacterium]